MAPPHHAPPMQGSRLLYSPPPPWVLLMPAQNLVAVRLDNRDVTIQQESTQIDSFERNRYSLEMAWIGGASIFFPNTNNESTIFDSFATSSEKRTLLSEIKHHRYFIFCFFFLTRNRKRKIICVRFHSGQIVNRTVSLYKSVSLHP